MRRLYVLGGMISTLRTFSSVAKSVSATNKRSPVRSSYRQMPTPNTSLRRSISKPCTCSGDMYPNLPFRMPACVRPALPAALAMPKSMIFTSPSYETRMFCGDTSRCTRLRILAGRVALVVRVVQALAQLHDDVAGHRHRDLFATRTSAVEDRAHVLAVDVLEGDEVAVVDPTQVENLGDVRVRQLHGDLRLVDEHRDELFILGNGGQDAFDRNHALEPLHTGGLRLEDLRHPADVDALEKVVLTERNGLSHLPSLARILAIVFPQTQLRLGLTGSDGFEVPASGCGINASSGALKRGAPLGK